MIADTVTPEHVHLQSSIFCYQRVRELLLLCVPKKEEKKRVHELTFCRTKKTHDFPTHHVDRYVWCFSHHVVAAAIHQPRTVSSPKLQLVLHESVCPSTPTASWQPRRRVRCSSTGARLVVLTLRVPGIGNIVTVWFTVLQGQAMLCSSRYRSRSSPCHCSGPLL
jgi:hypothetical protein